MRNLVLKLSQLEEDIKIINQLVNDAVIINDDIIKKLEEWQKNLPKIEKPKIPSFPNSIKETFKEKLEQTVG